MIFLQSLSPPDSSLLLQSTPFGTWRPASVARRTPLLLPRLILPLPPLPLPLPPAPIARPPSTHGSTWPRCYIGTAPCSSSRCASGKRAASASAYTTRIARLPLPRGPHRRPLPLLLLQRVASATRRFCIARRSYNCSSRFSSNDSVSLSTSENLTPSACS